MNRVLVTMSAVALAFHLGAGAACDSGADADEPRPNVLFIAIDDANDWIGCMGGHPDARTPNIDRLAERGVLFTNAHCAAPVCLASRTSVMCGRHPVETGVYSNWSPTKGEQPARELQLPILLSAAGYETLGAGKLYHGSAGTLFDQSFEPEQRWSPFSEESVRYAPDELPSKGSDRPAHVVKAGPGGREWTLPLNGLPSERNPDGVEGESFDWGPADVSDEEFGDARITNWARQKLEERRSRPFFLGVGYYRPHIPLFAPQRDFDGLPSASEIRLPKVPAGDLDDLGIAGRHFAHDPITAGTHAMVTKHGEWKEAVRAYLACLSFVDREIGRLLETLDDSAYAENTWIILWSDHGWHLGEKEHWGKWTGWRQSTRVPLIIVPPRNQVAHRGKTCAEAVSLVDLYPTLTELCRVENGERSSGVSLVPFIENPLATSDRAVLTSFDPGNYAIQTRSWRYLRYQNGEEELYDIQADPNEWRNLIADPSRTMTLESLRSRLDQVLRDLGTGDGS